MLRRCDASMADGEPWGGLDFDQLLKTARTLDPTITEAQFREKWAAVHKTTAWVPPPGYRDPFAIRFDEPSDEDHQALRTHLAAGDALTHIIW